MPFSVKGQGEKQVLVLDDSMAQWVKENPCLTLIPELEARQQIVAATDAVSKLTSIVQNHIDQKVKEKKYDNIISACTYALSANNKKKKEGAALIKWRDDVNEAFDQIMAAVIAGTRPIPTETELIAELPVLTWPEV
jgi:hypothetical protein